MKMRAIIIGAGRGQRLMPTTAHTPKCYAEVKGRRILDWILHAFAENNIHEIAFIGGYLIDRVKTDYPHFLFRHNVDWPNNNILASLMFAEDLMDQPFIGCYSDILFTPEVVRRLLASEGDMSLVVDTRWRERYVHRTEHPENDGEKVTVANHHITRIHREIAPEEAAGEFIGVAKFSVTGAQKLRHHYHHCRQRFAGKPFREAKIFEKAYLIQMFQEMIEAGEKFVPVETPGGYMEIDTQQDFDLARKYWS
jgi:choline kinase